MAATLVLTWLFLPLVALVLYPYSQTMGIITFLAFVFGLGYAWRSIQ